MCRYIKLQVRKLKLREVKCQSYGVGGLRSGLTSQQPGVAASVGAGVWGQEGKVAALEGCVAQVSSTFL